MKSPTAFVTRITIYDQTTVNAEARWQDMTNHSWQDVSQRASELKHYHNDSNSYSHHTTQGGCSSEKCVRSGGDAWDVRVANGKHSGLGIYSNTILRG